MKADAWMPLYVGDYLADTGHLTAAEHGAYLLLLMHSWRTGSLPADPARLAAISRMTAAEWKRSGDTITAFFTSEDGTLVSPRLEAERERAMNNKSQRVAAGKASADKRARLRMTNEKGSETGNENPTSVERPLNERANKTPDLHLHLHQEDTSPSETPAAPADARAVLWSEGPTILRRLTGKPDRQVRPFLGQMLRDLRDDCAALLVILREAEATRPIEPMAWLVQAVKARMQAGGKGGNRFDYVAEFAFGPAPAPNVIDGEIA